MGFLLFSKCEKSKAISTIKEEKDRGKCVCRRILLGVETIFILHTASRYIEPMLLVHSFINLTVLMSVSMSTSIEGACSTQARESYRPQTNSTSSSILCTWNHNKQRHDFFRHIVMGNNPYLSFQAKLLFIFTLLSFMSCGKCCTSHLPWDRSCIRWFLLTSLQLESRNKGDYTK